MQPIDVPLIPLRVEEIVLEPHKIVVEEYVSAHTIIELRELSSLRDIVNDGIRYRLEGHIHARRVGTFRYPSSPWQLCKALLYRRWPWLRRRLERRWPVDWMVVDVRQAFGGFAVPPNRASAVLLYAEPAVEPWR
jgi:hypothetical protein